MQFKGFLLKVKHIIRGWEITFILTACAVGLLIDWSVNKQFGIDVWSNRILNIPIGAIILLFIVTPTLYVTGFNLGERLGLRRGQGSTILRKQDIYQAISFFAVSYYVYGLYSSHLNLVESFTATLVLFAFLAILISIFGYLPVRFLKKKDSIEKNTIFSGTVYIPEQAASFIFREISDSLANRISEQEILNILEEEFELRELDNDKILEELILKFFHLGKEDIEQILTAEKSYLKSIGI